MNLYATNTQGKRNLAAMKAGGVRIVLTPGKHSTPPPGFLYAIDNGRFILLGNPGAPWDAEAFKELIEKHGSGADFVVVPDFPGKAEATFASFRLWIPYLKHLRNPLLAVQDGMTADDVGAFVRHYNCGIFLGGTTEWKLATLYGWGMVARALGCYYHVGRVNTVKRIRLCLEAGAHSCDGTSMTRYSCNVPKLTTAAKQPSMLTPAMTEGL